MRAIRFFLVLPALWLAACAGDPTLDLAEPPVQLGDFRLGHNIVVVNAPQAFPGSRMATDQEWKDAVTQALADRFGRYQGDALYHFGVSVDGYNLAVVDIPIPGVPSQKSALGIKITVWKDATQSKLNEEAKKIFVIGGQKGAGINPDKQTQLDHLAALAAKEVEKWLQDNPGWFGVPAASDE